MINSNLRLIPAKRRFMDEPRGKYSALIRQFMESGEPESAVEAPEIQTAYVGLRKAVSNMSIKNKIEVRRSDGEIHLIRKD